MSFDEDNNWSAHCKTTNKCLLGVAVWSIILLILIIVHQLLSLTAFIYKGQCLKIYVLKMNKFKEIISLSTVEVF